MIVELVRRCPNCNGVVFGPAVNQNGLLEEDEETAEWSCQQCDYSSIYVGEEPHRQIEISDKKRRELNRKSQILDYDDFVSNPPVKREG